MLFQCAHGSLPTSSGISLIYHIFEFSKQVHETAIIAIRPYRIEPNFRGAKFSRIGLLKHFVEINFAEQRFLIAMPVFRNNSRSLIFVVREESAKTAKIMRLENLVLYGTHFHANDD